MDVDVSFRQVGRERSGRLYRGPNSDAYSRISQPSIPGKDDLELEKLDNGSKGFGSRQPRFSPPSKQSPALRQYASLPASQAPSPSFSKKGFGGLISKTKRFGPKQFATIVPGPGSYSTSVHRRVQSNLSSIFVQPKHQSRTSKVTSPAPGQYNPSEPKPPTGLSAIFKSKTKRADNTFVTHGPAPWYYTPNDGLIRSSSQKLTSTFKKPVNGKRFKINLYDPHAPVLDESVPGPGYYVQGNRSEQESLSGSYSRSEIDRFGQSINPKKTKELSPGPGSYDIIPSLDSKEKQLVSGAVFMSESQREFLKPTRVPGPAFYKLQTNSHKKSFHLNPGQHWV